MIRPYRAKAVITGMGILAANGIGKEAFWKSLLENRSGIGPITLFDASDIACKIAGEVRGFEPDQHIDGDLKPHRMGRFTQLGVAAARMALEDAHLDRNDLKRIPELPVVLGVSTSGIDIVTGEVRLHTAVSSVPHAASSAIGYMVGRSIRLLTISNGCASSLDAIALAADLVRMQRADIVITGGAEGSVVRRIFEAMLKCRKCSTRNDDPSGASRPFDKLRDYGVLGEAAGILVIENRDHALARGVTPYAEITGYGTCADPPDAPEGGGMDRAMHFAIANAGFRPSDIQFISAHGPSDVQMDATETQMIKNIMGENAFAIPVTSIKGATGCPMGAGGVLQVAATALTLVEQILPPTTNYEVPDPECDLDYVPGTSRQVMIERAMINTHGFGRGNSCLVLERLD